MDEPEETRRRSRVRQVEIAGLAGVSQATVSIVLGNKRVTGRRVSATTRARILEAAQELGYSVNPVARNLAGGQNRLLGVYTFESVFPSGDRDFYGPFLVGIEHQAESLGYDLLLFTSASQPKGARSIYAGGVNRLALADGSILLGRQENKAEIARLARDRFPFVYVGRRDIPDADFSYVTGDYARATGEVLRHLVKLGHDRIVYLGVSAPREPDRDRERGWLSTRDELGLAPDRVFLQRATTQESPRQLIRQLWSKGTASAVVLEDPETAQQFFDAAEELGISVPDDLSIAVLGDLPSSPPGSVRWSGFSIPREAMGRRAVDLLLQEIDSAAGRHRSITVPCPLIEGDTTAPPMHTTN